MPASQGGGYGVQFCKGWEGDCTILFLLYQRTTPKLARLSVSWPFQVFNRQNICRPIRNYQSRKVRILPAAQLILRDKVAERDHFAFIEYTTALGLDLDKNAS